MSVIGIEAVALDMLMPMNVLLDRAGRIERTGPGLARLAGARRLCGRDLTACFAITRPAGVGCMETLLATAGRRLHLSFAEGRQVHLRGVLVPRPGGCGALLNLSLGLSELADLGGAGLTNSDFSATDPTVDMLYLIEAKSAAMTETRRLITRLHGAKTRAEEQAYTDTLTGLRNRRAFDRIVDRLLSDRVPFALCHVDLDYFKSVNDRLGHAAGDHVLRSVARTLIETTRQSDTVARVGGDEFVILFRELTDPEVLDRIGRRIIEWIERPLTFDGQICRVSASLGTAISTDYEVPRVEQMMADADTALYASKQGGRASHTIFVPNRVARQIGPAVIARD